MYYHRPANELIFLTRGEHTKLHNTGKHISEETRRKISKFHKGKSLNEEHRRKISEAMKGNTIWKGKHHTEETRKKMSEAKKGNTYNKGTHWYNNGSVNMCAFECPEGFVKGRLKYGK